MEIEENNALQKDIIGHDGKILHFSLKRFKKDIVEGNCCFICGASPSDKPFNDEHIIPDWILKRYNLYNQKITLPNLTKFNYSSYKIPCCVDCNRDLGDRYEKPISKIIKNGLSNVIPQMNEDLGKLFIHWLALIFFKTHIKDTSLNLFQDKSKGNVMIGDFYFWERLYYLHSFIRSFHTGITISPQNYGSLFILPAKKNNQFDYSDNFNHQGIYMNLGDFCFIYVLNDCGTVRDIFNKLGALKKIEGELSFWQMRELFAQALKINFQLKNRPKFQIKTNKIDQILLTSDIPNEILFNDDYSEVFNDICKGLYYVYMKEGRLSEEIYTNFCQEKFSFLFDENGKFRND